MRIKVKGSLCLLNPTNMIVFRRQLYLSSFQVVAVFKNQSWQYENLMNWMQLEAVLVSKEVGMCEEAINRRIPRCNLTRQEHF